MACSLAKVLEYLPGENQFVVRAGIGWQPGTVGFARVGMDLESPAGFAFQTGQPVLSNHLAQETRFRTPRLLLQHGVRRTFNVLIQAEGLRYGVLVVDSPDGGEFAPEGESFLVTLAATLAQALVRQRGLAELRASRSFVQGVLDASPDCVTVLSREGLLRFINRRGVEMNEFGSAEAVLGREFAGFWPEAERAGIRAAVAAAVAGEVVRVEGFCPTARGKAALVGAQLRALRAGRSARRREVICIARDVSERRDRGGRR